MGSSRTVNLWEHQGAVQKAQSSFKIGEASFKLKQNLSADTYRKNFLKQRLGKIQLIQMSILFGLQCLKHKNSVSSSEGSDRSQQNSSDKQWGAM